MKCLITTFGFHSWQDLQVTYFRSVLQESGITTQEILVHMQRKEKAVCANVSATSEGMLARLYLELHMWTQLWSSS